MVNKPLAGEKNWKKWLDEIRSATRALRWVLVELRPDDRTLVLSSLNVETRHVV
jgi:hypothetical protein